MRRVLTVPFVLLFALSPRPCALLSPSALSLHALKRNHRPVLAILPADHYAL